MTMPVKAESTYIFFHQKQLFFFKCMFGSAPTISHLQSRVATSLNGCNFFLVQLFLHHTVCNSWSQQCCSAYYVLYVNAPWNIKTTMGLKSQNHNPLIAFFISAAGRWHNISIFKQMAFVLTKLGLILIPLQLQDLFLHHGFETHSSSRRELLRTSNSINHVAKPGFMCLFTNGCAEVYLQG